MKGGVKLKKEKIDTKELVKEVNKFDKQFGVKLKHPEIWSEPERFRPVFEAKAEINIAALICSLNGVNIDEYYDNSTIVLNGLRVNPNGREFTEISNLNWEREGKYKTSSLMFKARFLTCVLSSFLGRIEKISDRKADDKHFKHSYDENRIIMTTEILDDITRIVKVMSSGNNYGNIIMKVFHHLSYSKKKYNHEKLKKRLYAQVMDVKKNMKSSVFNDKYMDDDLCINNILQISYILATGDYEGNHGTPNFREIEGATVKHDLIKLIEKLGKEIIKRDGRKHSPMFRAFVNASPLIVTKYGKEAEKLTVTMGIYAIEFTRFFMCDKDVSKFIDGMLRKGK